MSHTQNAPRCLLVLHGYIRLWTSTMGRFPIKKKTTRDLWKCQGLRETKLYHEMMCSWNSYQSNDWFKYEDVCIASSESAWLFVKIRFSQSSQTLPKTALVEVSLFPRSEAGLKTCTRASVNEVSKANLEVRHYRLMAASCGHAIWQKSITLNKIITKTMSEYHSPRQLLVST